MTQMRSKTWIRTGTTGLLKGVPTMNNYNLRLNYPVELSIFSSVNLHLYLMFPSKGQVVDPGYLMPPIAGHFPSPVTV